MAPQLEIVIPVFNEQRALRHSLERLHAFLTAGFPVSWRITVADNASTDATFAIARELARSLPGVRAVHLDEKGRGRALKHVWGGSDAPVVAYMDVDLSTDLRALLPLVAPLLSGHSDVAIGTRLAPGAAVVRGPRREVISRAYNRILRLTLRARFSDAQCGFKAIRADALRRLAPEIRDDGWFFDTELLVLAQRAGMRIHEVPVDWVDDPDSRVDVVRTAVEDLRGVARLMAASHVTRFAAIGVASTLAFAVLFALLTAPLGAGPADAAALGITGVANTAANRRLTFGVRGRHGLVRDHLKGLLVFAVTLLMTAGALAFLHALEPHAPLALEAAVVAVASTSATVTRYVALRSWVFARGRRPAPPALAGEGARG